MGVDQSGCAVGSDAILDLLTDTLKAQFYRVAFDDGRSVEWDGGNRPEILQAAHEHLRVVDANDAFARTCGYDGRAALLESEFLLANMFPDRHAFDLSLSAIFSLGGRTADDITRRSDERGQIRHIRSLTRLISLEGRVVGFYGVQWDVTEEHAARLALETQNKQLGCIQSISRLAELNVPTPDFLSRVADLIPSSMQYAEMAIAAIEFEGNVYGQKDALEASCRIAYGIVVNGQELGRVHIAYIEQRPFVAQESSYIRAVAERVSGQITRVRGEAQFGRLLADAQQSAQLLRSVIDATPDWIFIKDQQHRYRLVNKGYADSLHLKPEDFVGKDDLDLGFPEELVKGNPEKGIRGFWADDRLVMDGGQPQVYPDDLATIDGVVHVFNTLKTPLRDANGDVWGVLAFARDVTERERLLNDLGQRSVQLRTAAEVSRAASSILNSDELIRQAVNLIRDRFNYYYVGLFLTEQPAGSGRWAVLRAGTGEAGRTMVEQGHKLEIGGNSMVGSSIALGRARIALDVGPDEPHPTDEPHPPEAQRFDNPLLPQTRSEMALPLVVRGQVIGAITIQSEQERAFSEEDVTILQSMADQLAVAIRTATLFEQTQVRAEQERLVRSITDRLYRASDRETIMRVALQELKQVLGASRAVIQLGTGEQLLQRMPDASAADARSSGPAGPARRRGVGGNS